MKLYNLYEQVIFEEIQKHKTVITESVTPEEVQIAINGDDRGRHYHASFDYTKDNGETGNRWVQVYQLVKTTRGEPAISAYEVSSNMSGGDMNKRPGWKLYRLDRMSNFKISKVPFYKQIDKAHPEIVYNGKNKYNTTGNNAPTVSSVDALAKFDYQYADSTLKQQAKQPENVPVQAPVQIPEPVVRSSTSNVKQAPSIKPISRTSTSDIKPNVPKIPNVTRDLTNKTKKPEEKELDKEDNIELNK